ncbi:conjugal transfer protein TrbC, partial [Escherichia coli]|nr:conjugal transfer protein TrbC [Escherichia coli]
MTQMHVHAFRNSVNPVSTIARLRRLAGPAHHGLLLAAVMLMTAGTAKA